MITSEIFKLAAIIAIITISLLKAEREENSVKTSESL